MWRECTNEEREPQSWKVRKGFLKQKFLKRLNVELSYDPDTAPKYIPKRNENVRTQNVYTHVISVLLLIVKKWEQLKCLSADEWINRMWSMHMMDSYLSIKRNNTLIQAATWRDLKALCSVKEARHKRPYVIWFHLYVMSTIGKSIRDRKISHCQGLGEEGNGRWLLVGMGLLLGSDE